MKPMFRVKLDFDNVRIVDEEIKDLDDLDTCFKKVKKKVG